jgi:hypothetical protein
MVSRLAQRDQQTDGIVVFLIIGSDADQLSQQVASTLRKRGHNVIMTPDPLAGDGAFAWWFDTLQSQSQVRFPSEPELPSTLLRGVLVRALGGPVSAEGWTLEDFTYVQSETQAALLAWLWSLPCSVVNRMTADLWFRPQRPYPEWHALLVRSGLPTLNIQICNDPVTARDFADRWGGTVTYAPLTSFAHYPVASEQQWAELGKVMSVLPVCLMEPCTTTAQHACLVDHDVIWDGVADPGGGERETLEHGLRRLAAELRLDLLEITVQRGTAGLCCTGVNLYPNLGSYDATRHEMLVTGVINGLGGG